MSITNEWQEIALQDLAKEITVGFVGPMASEYVPKGIPFLRSLNVEPFRINHADLMYVSESFHQRIKKSTLTPGDVVIVRTGKPGTAAVIPDTLPIANCSDLVIVRPGPQLDSKFLAYYINSAAQHHVYAHTVGAVQQHFNVGSAKTLKLLKPPLDEQRAIVRILGALDDKIDLNRRMNRTLESMVQALFQSWFVDFEPVSAKREGRKPVGMNEATAALFPEHFQETDMGPIPVGWRITSIYDVAEVIYGAPFASALFNLNADGKPLIRIRDLVNESPSVYTPEAHAKGYMVQPGDIVVGMDGEFRAYLWGGIPSWLNQRVCVFAPKPPFSSPFVRCNINPLLAEIEATETATTVIHLGKNDIDRFKAIVPDEDVLKAFNSVCQPCYDRIVKNKQQLRTLAAQRDALLPQLLSGELKVGQAEDMIP